MKLIPYLVNIQEKNKISNVVLPNEFKEKLNSQRYKVKDISHIEYLDEKLFKEGTHLGSSLWTIYTHYSVAGKFYQLAFKIKTENNESIENFILRFKSYSSGKEEKYILRYLPDEDIFIDSSQYFLAKKIETKNIFDTAGFIVLEVENINNNTKEDIPIRVLPSSISYDDYIEMINDLISIREDIVISDGSKVGIGNHWEIRKDNYNNCIDNIYKHIIEIDKNPKGKLSMENIKMPYNKIKNIKSKTIIEKSIYPYKDKYITTVGNENLNIYENQIIKYSLVKIKEKIEKYKNEFEKNIKYNKQYLDDIKNEIECIWNSKVEHKEDELEKHVREVEEDISDILKNLSSSDKLELKDINERIYLNFKLGINIDENSIKKIYLKYNKETKEFTLDLATNKKSYNKDLDKFDYDLMNRNLQYKYLGQNEIYTGRFGKNRRIKFTFTSKNINKIKFLYDSLTNINNKVLDLVIVVKRNNYTNENPLLPINYYSDNGFEDFTIQCEDLRLINNIKPPYYTENQIKEFVKISMANLNLENVYEKLGFIKSLESDFKKIDSLKYNFYKVKSLDETLEKIEKLLNLQFMKDIKVQKDTLKPTQIFINDFSYNKVFIQLKKLNKKVRFLDNISPNMYFLKSTADIYENWCLYKIVNILINDLGWKLNNKDSVLKDINNLLNHNGKYNKPCVKIELEHKIKNNEIITLDLIYEGKIYYDENKYKTPDFQFIFKSRSIGEKRVYLDAKYRNYKEQGIDTFFKDINHVSIGKYYIPFIDTVNKSQVSFIVHSDKDKKFECFGGNHIIEDYKIKEVTAYNQSLDDATENNHRFGAFYLLPSYSFNINKFLRMILEYHLGMYDMCWSCGEVDDITKKDETTAGGYPKYHYKCNKCDEFWVKNHCRTPNQHKLIKHKNNYHTINKDKKDPWYVTCPICFNGIAKEYKVEKFIPDDFL